MITNRKLLPIPKVLVPIENGRVLVFAPHQDDETLGCGGTLALLRKNGCKVKVVFVTDGAGAGTLPEGASEIRRKEATAALSVFGIDDLIFLDEPDGSFRNSPQFEQKIVALLQQFRPDWLFLPSILDYHRDHLAIGKAIFNCWYRCHNAGRAFFYEVWNPLPATCVFDISSVAELKRSAISLYELPLSQTTDYLSASMGLAAYRGLYLPGKSSRKFAEAFVEIEKNSDWFGILREMRNVRSYGEKLLMLYFSMPQS